MSELRDAIAFFDSTGDLPSEVVYSPEQLVILAAARRVANPVGRFEANANVVVWTESFGFATAAYTSLDDGEYLVLGITEDTNE